MHKENSWYHTRTQNITGVNKAPGSPRAWINRALDIAGSEMSQSQVQARAISVAAVWIRPCVTMPLPYDCLIRYFDYELNKRNNKWVPKPPASPAIGIAWTVPFDDIFQVIKLLKMSGAEMIWWATPIPEPEKPKTLSELGLRSKHNHQMLYERFDQGQKPRDVARDLGALNETITYVYKKWKSGRPAHHMHFGRKPLNHQEILDDLRVEDCTMQTVADKHGCTRFTVHKIAKANGLVRA